MSEQPWGGKLPQNVKDAIDDVFPGSEERRKIAYTLMFYNHKPSGDELKRLSEAAGRSLRTVQHVIRILGENNLFTSELGSVPLYKHIGTVGHSKALESLSGAKGREETEEEAETAEDEGEEPEAPIIEDGDEAPDESVEEDAGPFRRALPAAVDSAVEARGLRESLVKMAHRQDRLEATVDASLKEILARMRSQEPATPLVVPVVKANTLTVDPPEEEEVETEPVRREEPEADAELGPFSGMSKKDILDMAMNDPDGIHAMVRGYSRGEKTIMATPETMRWMGVMLSTYTQSAFERSISDGYEGTLSDFLNDCVYMYFADRGKVLQWADLPTPGRMPFPQRRMS